MIDLTMAYDEELEFLSFNTTGTNISVAKTVNASKENQFTHSYILPGPEPFQLFVRIISTMLYQNIADEPLNQDIRVILITLPSQSSNSCSIFLEVVNLADPPIIDSIQNYRVNYFEDSVQSLLLFDNNISISDQDNSFLVQATINITNQPTDIEDALFSPINPDFIVNGNGTRQLNASAISDQLPHEAFLNFVGGVSFRSKDQAPYILREITLFFTEFPTNRGIQSNSIVTSVNIIPVNDQPRIIGEGNFFSA
ncbi:hypothetical protein LOD99_7823 [Oopsacas minuta]|uniref:Uncharacterized protein n=1 Tax=Oopsacas minuta TaxID=111878 RepID=A0AAV7JPK1_9METZ|nr:hypothetical protein LOD99_7823 [Oopsacas minuta]